MGEDVLKTRKGYMRGTLECQKLPGHSPGCGAWGGASMYNGKPHPQGPHCPIWQPSLLHRSLLPRANQVQPDAHFGLSLPLEDPLPSAAEGPFFPEHWAGGLGGVGGAHVPLELVFFSL